jgi:hypothetical protein
MVPVRTDVSEERIASIIRVVTANFPRSPIRVTLLMEASDKFPRNAGS